MDAGPFVVERAVLRHEAEHLRAALVGAGATVELR